MSWLEGLLVSFEGLPLPCCPVDVTTQLWELLIEHGEELTEQDRTGEEGVDALLLDVTELCFPLGEHHHYVGFVCRTGQFEARATVTLPSHTLLLPGEGIQLLELSATAAVELGGEKVAGIQQILKKTILPVMLDDMTHIGV